MTRISLFAAAVALAAGPVLAAEPDPMTVSPAQPLSPIVDAESTTLPNVDAYTERNWAIIQAALDAELAEPPLTAAVVTFTQPQIDTWGVIDAAMKAEEMASTEKVVLASVGGLKVRPCDMWMFHQYKVPTT